MEQTLRHPARAARRRSSLSCVFRHLIGAIAQLGERLNGIQEVGGSNSAWLHHLKY